MQTPLIHIGHHKTGSTWLQQCLFNHAGVGLTMPLENLELVDLIVVPNDLVFEREKVKRDLQERISRIPEGMTPVFSAERISGNPHSGGYDSKLLADRVRYLFDDARVLLVLREQRDMIFSSYNQFIKVGGAISLSRYMDTTGRRHIYPRFELRHFEFHHLIRYYYELFGRDKVMVLPYELFRQDSKAFVRQIVAFANPDAVSRIEQANIPYSKRINTSLSNLELLENRAINYVFGIKNHVNRTSLFPLKPSTMRGFVKGIQTLNRVVPDSVGNRYAAGLRNYISSQTQGYFCESNRETSALIGIDLSAYGYEL